MLCKLSDCKCYIRTSPQTFAAEAAVVFEQEEVTAAWVAFAADCALENHRSDPMHRLFGQEKGNGDDEGNHHHPPLLKEWV